MSDDFFEDFGKSVLDIFGAVTNIGPLPVAVGKIVIGAIAEDAKRQETEAHKSLAHKIETQQMRELTKAEIPILRRALNRTINILSRGKIKDALE